MLTRIVLCAIVWTPVVFARSKDPLRDNITSVCQKLFAKGARPHGFYVYTSGNLDWLLDPNNLGHLRNLGFGHLVFFENLYTGRSTPVGKDYFYSDPIKVLQVQTLARRFGFDVVGYINGPKCRVAGLSPTAILFVIKRKKWDGVYLDNGDVGTTVWQDQDFFRRLRAMISGPIIHHASVEPRFGRVFFSGPWAQMEDYRLWGETNAPLNTLHDWRWKQRVARVLTGSTIGMVKLAKTSLLRATPDRWMPYMPRLLCTVRAARGVSLQQFERFYWPAWKTFSKLYQTDPKRFIDDRVKFFRRIS